VRRFENESLIIVCVFRRVEEIPSSDIKPVLTPVLFIFNTFRTLAPTWIYLSRRKRESKEKYYDLSRRSAMLVYDHLLKRLPYSFTIWFTKSHKDCETYVLPFHSSKSLLLCFSPPSIFSLVQYLMIISVAVRVKKNSKVSVLRRRRRKTSSHERKGFLCYYFSWVLCKRVLCFVW